MTEGCYCVCHSPYSSKAWCEHCEGDNQVGRVPRCAGPTVSVPPNASGLCARALPCPHHGNKKVTELEPGEKFIICTHVVVVDAS